MNFDLAGAPDAADERGRGGASEAAGGRGGSGGGGGSTGSPGTTGIGGTGGSGAGSGGVGTGGVGTGGGGAGFGGRAGFGGTDTLGDASGITDGVVSISDASSDQSVPPDASCVPDPVRVERKPSDLYVMIDCSGSMDMIDPAQTNTRWSNLEEALSTFLNDPLNDGLKLGIDFFPQGGVTASCNVTDYTLPDVAIDTVPGVSHTQADALLASVKNHARAGGTPTSPALMGALQTASAWQSAHPDRSLAVVLLTDGQPTGCPLNDNSVAGAAAAAQSALTAQPSVKTYVLGIGPDTGNLDSIAAAGGTSTAYTAADGAATTLAAALAALRKDARTCEYGMPFLEASVIDVNRVNIQIHTATNFAEDVPRVIDGSSCGSGLGWYYDDAVKPTKVVLCPDSCASLLTSDDRATFLLGCNTQDRPPPN